MSSKSSRKSLLIDKPLYVIHRTSLTKPRDQWCYERSNEGKTAVLAMVNLRMS